MGPNTAKISTKAPSTYLSINMKGIELEKVSLSNMKNLPTVCEHIDCQSQVFSSY